MNYVHFICSGCGKIRRRREDLKFNCSCSTITFPDNTDSAKAPPGILAKGFDALKAWIKWDRAGKPIRSLEEVEQVQKICSECSYYQGRTCTHEDCKCTGPRGSWLTDKTVWATEHCPLEKW